MTVDSHKVLFMQLIKFFKNHYMSSYSSVISLFLFILCSFIVDKIKDKQNHSQYIVYELES